MELVLTLQIPEKEKRYIEALIKTKGLKLFAYGEDGMPWGLDYMVSKIEKRKGNYSIEASAERDENNEAN